MTIWIPRLTVYYGTCDQVRRAPNPVSYSEYDSVHFASANLPWLSSTNHADPTICDRKLVLLFHESPPFFRCAFMFRCPQPAIYSFSGLFVQTVMLSGHFYEESVNVIAIRYRERKESLFIANKAKATSLNSAILSSVGKFQQKWFDKTFVKSNQAQLFNVRVLKRVNNQIYFRLLSWVAWYHAWQSSSLMGRNGMTMNFF